MTNVNETVQVTLTAEELEFLNAKREEARLAIENAKSEEQKKLEAAEKQVKTWIAEKIKADDKQIQAATEYATKFTAPWELRIIEKEKVEKVTDSMRVEKKDENGNPVVDENGVVQKEWVSPTLYEETFVSRKAVITDGRFTVNVKEHFTSSSSWSSRSINNGFKMYLSGKGIDYSYENKPLKNAATIITKCTDIVEAEELQRIANTKAKNAKQTAVNNLKAEYPDATVEVKEEYVYSRYARTNAEGRYETRVTMTFTNKVAITYVLYSDGSLSRYRISYPKMDEADFRNKLSNMQF